MSDFAHDDIEIVAKERCYSGYFAIDKYTLRHRLFNGGWSEPFVRELFERGHAVAVVLFDPLREEVILLEQFRIGALTSERSPWMIEIVAGIIEDGETAESVAIREVYEEAGQQVEQVEYIGKYFCTPGASSESIALYCAMVDSHKAAGVFGLAHENEDIRVFTMTLTEVRQALHDGYFENATSLIGMQWLLLNAAELKSRWLE